MDKNFKELNELYKVCCERVNCLKGKTDTTELEIKISNAYDAIEKKLKALEIIKVHTYCDDRDIPDCIDLPIRYPDLDEDEAKLLQDVLK